MSTIIKGLLSQNLPWGLVLVGVFISVTLELCGIHSLSFAVGSYLPIATTAPIFAGGLVRAYVERKTGRRRGIGSRVGHALQLGPDRRRLAGRHPLCGAVRQRHRARRRRGRRADPVDSRRHGGHGRRRAAVLRARRRAVADGTTQADLDLVPFAIRRPLVVLTLIAGASLAWSVAAQPSGRVATTVEALLAEPVFFHGRQMAFRSAVVQERGGTRLAVTDSTAPATPRRRRRASSRVRLLASGAHAGATARSAASSGTSGGCARTTPLHRLRLQAGARGRERRTVAQARRGLRRPRRQPDRSRPTPTPRRSAHRADAGALRRPRRHRHRPLPRPQSASAISRTR